ncbi:hypothetical protein N0V90_005506 [Kalmusia sp. IMI 367209]|nr:hypothetical protein N0V90_005506 [Kalmusia sp. IMI 367209]
MLTQRAQDSKQRSVLMTLGTETMHLYRLRYVSSKTDDCDNNADNADVILPQEALNSPLPTSPAHREFLETHDSTATSKDIVLVISDKTEARQHSPAQPIL